MKKDICAGFQKLKDRTIIGLTGAAASGKSAVLDRFRQLGAFCVSTDVLAKEVICSKHNADYRTLAWRIPPFRTAQICKK